jgi:hypothetical protein
MLKQVVSGGFNTLPNELLQAGDGGRSRLQTVSQNNMLYQSM